MKTIKRMMDHLYWADERILVAMETSQTKDKDLLKLLRHIAVAEQVWLSRLQGNSSRSFTLWENPDGLSEVRALFEENAKHYREYIEGLKESDLDSLISYGNKRGQINQTSVRDILSQVLLHGQYHRGQINQALRRESSEPSPVDFIVFARS